jgi:hypothetical protein
MKAILFDAMLTITYKQEQTYIFYGKNVSLFVECIVSLMQHYFAVASLIPFIPLFLSL